MWWLVAICGYQVRSATDTPQKTLLGGVRLVRHWSLQLSPLIGKGRDIAWRNGVRSCNHTFWTGASVGATYDAGDNLLTKVEPFKDSFNDVDYTGWSTSGTWNASNHYMRRPHCV
jgi:hypothetical protein